MELEQKLSCTACDYYYIIQISTTSEAPPVCAPSTDQRIPDANEKVVVALVSLVDAIGSIEERPVQLSDFQQADHQRLKLAVYLYKRCGAKRQMNPRPAGPSEGTKVQNNTALY